MFRLQAILCTVLLFWQTLKPTEATALHPQIPSVVSFTGTNGPGFVLSFSPRIVVDSRFQNNSDTPGGPSLLGYAETFREDLIWLTGFTAVPEVTIGSEDTLTASPRPPTIFLTLGASNHTYYNGVATVEGYDFVVSDKSYIIRGGGAIGVWWGTRSLLQQVALNSASSSETITIPAGSGSDSPGWEIRGFMLDAARHWFELPFLADLCIYASFFKIQSFHIHASDNIWDQNFISGPDWRDLYAAFRFQPAPGSPVAGIVQLQNETWTREGWEGLQTTCAEHGVTVVPEIDTPGHALVFSKWKPELMIPGTPDELNLSYPDTIPTIKAVWDEVLPWFTSSEVSIGADEYDSALADVYISFVNSMSEYISSASGKATRIWGTYEPPSSPSLSISKNITIQHWDFPGDSIPVQLLASGYRVINSEQSFLYLDGKTSDGGQFPVELDQELMWGGAPGGGGWAPNVFSASDGGNNTIPEEKLLRGAIMALWNDWGNNATTPLEIYYQLARSLAVFGEKTWAGSGVRDTALTRNQFDAIYETLNAAAPGQNLNRVVVPPQPGSDTIFEYDKVTERIETRFKSVGPPYTLRFTIKPSGNASSVLFAGTDSRLHFPSLAFEDPSTGVYYPLAAYGGLPLDSFTTIEIHATRDFAYAVIDHGQEGQGKVFWWETNLDIWGEYMKAANMSFAAPSRFIGMAGGGGELYNVSLRLGP